MSFLPTQSTPPVGDLSDQTILIYGPPKIGKSTFGSQFPDALFLPFEAGLNHLDCFQAPPEGIIETWPQFMEVLGEIAAGGHPFRTLIIDTIDVCWALCAQHICGARGVEYLGDLEHGKGWGIAGNEFRRVLGKMIALPYGIVMISHAKTEENKKLEVNRWVPTIPGSARKLVSALSDMILFANVREFAGEDGKLQTERVLYTKPSIYHEAGDRTGRLPDFLPLGFDDFRSEYEKNTEQQQETETIEETKPETEIANVTD